MSVLPYLQFSVEEASSITCLDHWSNLRARLVGRLMRFDPLTGAGRLEAVGEGTGANIALSFALILDSVTDWLSQGVLLQVIDYLLRARAAEICTNIFPLVV